MDTMFKKEYEFILKYDSVNNGYNSTYETDTAPTKCGEEHPNAKLSNNDIYDIREAYSKALDPKDIYIAYKNKISYSAFINIWRGYHYKNIHMDVYTEELKKEYAKKGNDYKIYNSGIYNSTIKHVMSIREDYINEKLSPSEVYQKHSELNRSTFNDIWYGKTFINIAPEGYFEKLKSGRKYIRRGNNKNANKHNKSNSRLD